MMPDSVRLTEAGTAAGHIPAENIEENRRGGRIGYPVLPPFFGIYLNIAMHGMAVHGIVVHGMVPHGMEVTSGMLPPPAGFPLLLHNPCNP